MPKQLRIIAIVIILIIFSGFAYLLMSGKTDEPDNNVTSTAQSNPSTQPETEKLPAAGSYIDYSAEIVAATKGQRILFFHAPWCPQCRQLDASIKAGTIPNDVTIIKVDYDGNQNLRKQYSVTIQTTLVLIDSDGNEIKKYVAYDQPNLNSVIENLL